MKARFERIKQMEAEHTVMLLCEAFDASRSGYYAWRQRAPSRRAREDAQLKELICQEHVKSRKTYGRPRLQAALLQGGRRHSSKRIGRLMKAADVRACQRRRFRPCTTDSNHGGPIAPNHLAQRPAPQKQDETWVTDLTCVQTGEGWLYVSAILDLFSRAAVGWAFGESMETTLPLAALRMALAHRQPKKGLLHHSDRGSQYASAEYRAELARQGIEASMSRPANCYDNAAMESFWSTLKKELVYREKFATRAQAQAAIFDYIEKFYNRVRLHSALGYKSPVDFETANN